LEIAIAYRARVNGSVVVSQIERFIPGSRGQEAGGEGVAAEVFDFVLLGKKNFPLKQINRDIHFGERKIGAAFFGKGRTGVEKYEGNCVGAVGAEAGTEKRYARAVGALDRFYFFAGHIGRHDSGTGGEADLQKRLRLVFHGESYFSERFAFDGDQSGDDGAFGDCGQDAG